MSCSDDGTVHIVDFSPLSRNDPANDGTKSESQEQEELRIRRSNRNRQNNTEIELQEIELTPDGFRPGQRNKKLDTLCCTSQGLVLAGTNTGELFVWKVYFSEL
jgi:hypothetical protein